MAAALGMGVDQAELEMELARTRRKLEEWALSRQQGAADTKARHMHTMQDQTAKMQSLQHRQQQLDSSAQQVKQRIEREEGEASTLRGAADTLLSEREALQQRLASLKEALAAQEAECMRKEAESVAVEDSARKKQAALRKALAVYASRLGLEFRQGQDDLMLVFTHIDPRQPARQFSLGMRVHPDNTYQVTLCEPRLSDLPSLLQHLNTTSDFSSFVKAARKQFQALASSS